MDVATTSQINKGLKSRDYDIFIVRVSCAFWYQTIVKSDENDEFIIFAAIRNIFECVTKFIHLSFSCFFVSMSLMEISCYVGRPSFNNCCIEYNNSAQDTQFTVLQFAPSDRISFVTHCERVKMPIVLVLNGSIRRYVQRHLTFQSIRNPPRCLIGTRTFELRKRFRNCEVSLSRFKYTECVIYRFQHVRM